MKIAHTTTLILAATAPVANAYATTRIETASISSMDSADVSFVSFLGSEGEESQESNYFEKSLRKHLIIRKKLVHVRHDVSHSI